MQTLIPERWVGLMSELNGRIPDGTAGIRDIDAPCDAFMPVGAPYEYSKGTGDCDTDGHYICLECIRISLREVRRRRELCLECGTKLVRVNHVDECPALCGVPLWELVERERSKARAELVAALEGGKA